MKFVVVNIENIKWFLTSFDCLTIPNEQKKIIIALAKTRLNLMFNVLFDNFVTSKKRDLNVLLQ